MVGLVLDVHSDKCVSIRRIHPQVEPHCCPQALQVPEALLTAGFAVGVVVAAEPTTLVEEDDKTFEVFRAAEEDDALSRNLMMMMHFDWSRSMGAQQDRD